MPLMNRLIVTHRHPDLDAVMSAWLLHRFDPYFSEANFVFVPAGTAYKGLPPDGEREVANVDTGGGKFDHHQPGKPDTCASVLVREDLISRGHLAPTDLAIAEMTEVARDIDLFHDLFWPEPDSSRYAFMLHEILPSLHNSGKYDDEAVLRIGLVILDAVYARLKNIENAKHDIQNGEIVETRYGKTIIVESQADDLSKVAQKMGYGLAVVLDPYTGYIRIKSSPAIPERLDLLYAKICEVDEKAAWVYHIGGHMLFTGTSKGPAHAPSKLTFAEVVDIIKKIEKN